MKEKYDNFHRYRCPKLGGEIDFSFCRNNGSGLFCNRIVHCWIGKIPDIVDYLKEYFTDEQIKNSFEGKNKRINIIVDSLKKKDT